MNFLAHAVLSMNDPEILTGNMISDHVKGRKQYDFSPGIQRGIRLHRAIDQYTDLHPITKEAKMILYPAAGPYAGALIDIVYDHFLALDENEEPDSGWHAFSQTVYAELNARNSLLPTSFQQLLPYMTEYNWLVNYRHLQQIEQSFHGLARRAKYFNTSRESFDMLQENYAQFQQHYNLFFPDLKKFVSLQFEESVSE
jgi:acyl carrier protein phosphodiesterase